MRFAFALLVLLTALTGRAALPPLAYFGALRGEINFPQFPPLTWTLTAAPPEGGRQSAIFVLTGAGLAIRASVDADETTGALSWRLEEGVVNLAPWFTALTARFAPSLSGIAAQGKFRLSGRGTLQENLPVGLVTIAFTDATFRNATDGWALEGVSFAGEFALGPGKAVKSVSPFALDVRTISTSRFGARAFVLRALLNSLDEIDITTARVEIAGGEVEAAPFTLPLAPVSIDARLSIKRIGLQDFVALVPSGLTEARGRLDGEVRLGWSEAKGMQLGIGNLALDEVEPTILRLAPSPGFLTSRIPARFAFLPGAVGRWLSFRNQSYNDLRDIELGHADLAVNSLRIVLTPDGDDEGRSARVFVDATPLQPNGSVKQVLFTVNVAGPLSTLLHLGMTQNFSTEFH